MNGSVLLAHYGIVLPSYDLISTQFLVRSVKETELVREFDRTGIFYTSKESVEVVLRIYLGSYASKAILEAAGVTVHQLPVAVETATDEETGTVLHYVEYPISSTNLEDSKDVITNHPEFIRLYNKSDKNMRVFDEKLGSYNQNLTRIDSMGSFEPDELEDEGDDGLTGGASLSTNSINAQADAHRIQQQKIRGRLTDILDFFSEKIIKDGSVVETVTFNEAVGRYKDILVNDEPILSSETLVADLSGEIVVISAN